MSLSIYQVVALDLSNCIFVIYVMCPCLELKKKKLKQRIELIEFSGKDNSTGNLSADILDRKLIICLLIHNQINLRFVRQGFRSKHIPGLTSMV